MDLIFKGDKAVAINPDQVFVQRDYRTYNGEKQYFYEVVAFSINKNDWLTLSDDHESLEDAIKELDRIYQEAVDLALKYKEAKSNDPIKFEDINIEIRDFKEEK